MRTCTSSNNNTTRKAAARAPRLAAQRGARRLEADAHAVRVHKHIGCINASIISARPTLSASSVLNAVTVEGLRNNTELDAISPITFANR